MLEVPVKVEKDWVHMDKIEYEKLEWMKDLPKPQAGDSKVHVTLSIIRFSNFTVSKYSRQKKIFRPENRI